MQTFSSSWQCSDKDRITTSSQKISTELRTVESEHPWAPVVTSVCLMNGLQLGVFTGVLWWNYDTPDCHQSSGRAHWCQTNRCCTGKKQYTNQWKRKNSFQAFYHPLHKNSYQNSSQLQDDKSTTTTAACEISADMTAHMAKGYIAHLQGKHFRGN